MSRSLPVFYSCERCPGYCCSYPRIEAKARDLERLARHFGISVGAARRRFTKQGSMAGERVLRHKQDEHYGSVCHFLDTATRRCTVYPFRPQVCREFPGLVRCGYYDFLSFERRLQEDPNYVSTTFNR